MIERKLLLPKVLNGKPYEMATDIIMYKMKVGERQAYNILSYLLREGYFITRPRMIYQIYHPTPKPPPWTQT